MSKAFTVCEAHWPAKGTARDSCSWRKPKWLWESSPGPVNATVQQSIRVRDTEEVAQGAERQCSAKRLLHSMINRCSIVHALMHAVQQSQASNWIMHKKASIRHAKHTSSDTRMSRASNRPAVLTPAAMQPWILCMLKYDAAFITQKEQLIFRLYILQKVSSASFNTCWQGAPTVKGWSWYLKLCTLTALSACSTWATSACSWSIRATRSSFLMLGSIPWGKEAQL